MKNFLKKLIAVVFIPCLILTGCTRNNTAYIYTVEGNKLVATHLQLQEATPNKLVELLVAAQVLQGEISVIDFTQEREQNVVTLTVDFNQAFKDYLCSLSGDMQAYTVQAVANSFLKTFEANNVQFLSQGQPILTDVYNFSGKIGFAEYVESHIVTPTPTVEPTATLTPTPELTPDPTATNKPTTAPNVDPGSFATPDREAGKKYVALTFDDGPHKKYTRLIVDKLKEYNASATFFIVGNRVNAETGAAIKYAVDNGCEVEIHGFTHEYYYNKCSDAVFESELSKTASVIEQYTGRKPTLMRPIGGSITKARIASCQYSVVLWNVDSEDWKNKSGQAGIDKIVHNVMSTVGDGKIILMHEIYENSYQAFCIIIDQLYAQGYEVLSVGELIGKENLKPGLRYYCA